MSNIKSYQRLLAVQAIYEASINKEVTKTSIDELLLHIIENVDFKNKVNGSKLLLTKQIYNGVFSNLEKIDLIFSRSLKKKRDELNYDKLLIAIFRCAIYEIALKRDISKKIVISEYLMISNHFFSNKEATFLNGVLDNLK